MNIDVPKLQHGLLTNLGCESEFAKLDICVVASGGLTTVQTHSHKHFVTKNCLFADPSFS